MVVNDCDVRVRDLHLQPGHIVDSNLSVESLVNIIKSQKSSNRTFIVMQDSLPIGIVRSSDMFRLLGIRFGVSLYYNKPLHEVMYSNILIVDCNTSIEEVSRKAMTRPYEDIYDDIIVMNQGKYVGVIPVYELLTFMTDYKIREATQKNPLTGLPGNEKIDEIFHYNIQQKKPVSVIYVDIDHFKSYNDVYGFKNGDDVIKWVSSLLQYPDTIGLFVGHIGGDDFVIFLSPDSTETYCQQVIELFEKEVHTFYSVDDIERGYIESLDRDHRLTKYPLMAISMAILDIEHEDLSFVDVSSMAAQIKKHAKQIEGSNYFKRSTLHFVKS